MFFLHEQTKGAKVLLEFPLESRLGLKASRVGQIEASPKQRSNESNPLRAKSHNSLIGLRKKRTWTTY
jgi:hypothetical protein